MRSAYTALVDAQASYYRSLRAWMDFRLLDALRTRWQVEVLAGVEAS